MMTLTFDGMLLGRVRWLAVEMASLADTAYTLKYILLAKVLQLRILYYSITVPLLFPFKYNLAPDIRYG